MKVFQNGTGNPIPNLAPFRTGLCSNASRVRAFFREENAQMSFFPSTRPGMESEFRP